MSRKKASINATVKEILATNDYARMKKKLCALRWERTVSDDAYYQVFSLVALSAISNNGGETDSRSGHKGHNPLRMVADWMAKNHCRCQVDDRSVKTGFRLANCAANLIIFETKDPPVLTFQVPFVLRVPNGAMDRVSRRIAEINNHLWVDAFYLDQEDGELGFRLALPVPGNSAIVEEQIDDCILICCRAVDKFYPEFARACWGPQE